MLVKKIFLITYRSIPRLFLVSSDSVLEGNDEAECTGGSSIDPPREILPRDTIEFVDRPLPISHRTDEVIPTSAVAQVDNLSILPKPLIMEGVKGIGCSKDTIRLSNLNIH